MTCEQKPSQQLENIADALIDSIMHAPADETAADALVAAIRGGLTRETDYLIAENTRLKGILERLAAREQKLIEALEKIRDSAVRRIDGAPDEAMFKLKWCQQIARIALSPDPMKASPSAEAIQTLDTWQPPPDDGSGLLAAVQVNDSIEATLVEPTPSRPKPDADDLVRKLEDDAKYATAQGFALWAGDFREARDRIFALQAHIADLYKAIKNAIRALKSLTGET